MSSINMRLDKSNIFYELDNLVLFGERFESEYVDSNILFGEQTEIEMDFLTPEGKVDHAVSKIFNEESRSLSYEELMDSWTPDAKAPIPSKSPEKSAYLSYEELLDSVNFGSTPLTGKSLDEEIPSSKNMKDRVTENPDTAIAGTTLLVTSIVFGILAITCPHSSALLIFYSVLSATASASGGALLVSTFSDNLPHEIYNTAQKYLFVC